MAAAVVGMVAKKSENKKKESKIEKKREKIFWLTQ